MFMNVIVIVFFIEICINNDNIKCEFCWILILIYVIGIKLNVYFLVCILEMVISFVSLEVYIVFFIYFWCILVGKRCVFEGILSFYM